jgi:hypothetical protein
MTRTNRYVVCAYAATHGAGTGTLTWSQQFMHKVISTAGDQPGNFDVLVTQDLAGRPDVATAQDLLCRLVEDHPVLRTTMSYDAENGLVQCVRSAGEFVVPIVSGTASLRAVIPETTLDVMCRAALLTDGTAVTGIALRISHLIVDAQGARLLCAALVDLAAGRPRAVSPSPLDLAAFEASEAGRRVQRRSLAHAAAVYESAPVTMWHHRRAPQPERYWYGELRSAALLRSLRLLRERHDVTRAGALVGALATVTAARAGTDAALLFLISANRFDLAWASFPGLLTQEAVVGVPVAGTVAGIMRSATTLSMRAMLHARYAPAEMDGVRREVGDRRGSFDGLGTAVVLNLLSPEASTSEVADRPTEFTWRDRTNEENLGLYVDAYETPHGFVLGGRIDTTLLSPAEAEGVLRAVEWTIVAAASTDMPSAEVGTYLAG